MSADSLLNKCLRNQQLGHSIDRQDKKGRTLLFLACASNDTAAFHWLMDRGANVNIQDNLGKTALFNAAKKGNQQMIQRLLDNGALHNTSYLCKKPIHEAVENGHAHVLHLFAPYVNDPGFLDHTPLMIDDYCNSFACVKILLELGAKVNLSTGYGYTPLICVCNARQWQVMDKIILLYLEHGADPNVRYEGQSPIDYLIKRQADQSVIDLVLKMGARSEHFENLHLTRRAELLALVE